MEKSVIFPSNSAAKAQVAVLLKKYPDLQTVTDADDKIVIEGRIYIARVFNDFPIAKNIQLEITIPILRDGFPCVKDIGEHIDKKYPHKYLSGNLCLATDIDLRLHFVNGFDLLKWMEDFVEPFYYSYEYYQRFSCYPFGDRKHGYDGIIESYYDWFSPLDMEMLNRILLKIESNDRYRGHNPCFCGSGKKMRNCHGQQILYFYQYPQLRTQLISDINNLRKEYQEHERKRNRYSSK